MEVFACYIKDAEQLNYSTSGGAFYEFAKKIIQAGGVVFGASIDDEGQVYHTSASSLGELEKLRQSKYVQSRMYDTYIKVKQILENNELVLFSGTPCQIAGLKGFLQIEYEKLICVEVLCHGVPSQHEFNIYKENLALGQKVDYYMFRSKCQGWDNMHIQYFVGGTKKVAKFQEDDFLCAFDKKYNLRKCCYNCKFKGENSCADVTIGDYWGIQQQHPEFYNKMGVSVVVIRSERGRKLFELCLDGLSYVKSSYEKALYNNPPLFYGYTNINKRNKYFELCGQNYDRREIIQLLEGEEFNYNITIIGSYSSRLMVNKIRERNPVIKIREHFINSTLASICSDEILSIDDNEVVCSNNFRKQSVLNDLHKKFRFQKSVCSMNNWLVIDLLEERYDNIVYDNTFITDSEAFQECNICTDAKRISFLDMPMSMWKQYCMKFIRIVQQKYQSDHIILNCIYLAELHGRENKTIPFENIEHIRKINNKLRECYKFICENLYGIVCIDKFDSNVEYCSDLFEFGCEPVYYNIKKYLSGSEILESIILKGKMNE